MKTCCIEFEIDRPEWKPPRELLCIILDDVCLCVFVRSNEISCCWSGFLKLREILVRQTSDYLQVVQLNWTFHPVRLMQHRASQSCDEQVTWEWSSCDSVILNQPLSTCNIRKVRFSERLRHVLETFCHCYMYIWRVWYPSRIFCLLT